MEQLDRRESMHLRKQSNSRTRLMLVMSLSEGDQAGPSNHDCKDFT